MNSPFQMRTTGAFIMTFVIVSTDILGSKCLSLVSRPLFTPVRNLGANVGLNRCKEIAMPIYMKITKNGLPVITGDVTAQGHEKWIELLSAQMGQFKSTAANKGDTREASKPTVSEIVITKAMDSASSALFQQSLHGEGVTIQIDFVKSDNSTYLTFTLQDVLISSYQTATSRSDRPTENLTLNFTKMAFDMHRTDVSDHAETLIRAFPG
jgi:type VI secretion system secreted protein Hcp